MQNPASRSPTKNEFGGHFAQILHTHGEPGNSGLFGATKAAGSNFSTTPSPWGWSVQPNATCALEISTRK